MTLILARATTATYSFFSISSPSLALPKSFVHRLPDQCAASGGYADEPSLPARVPPILLPLPSLQQRQRMTTVRRDYISRQRKRPRESAYCNCNNASVAKGSCYSLINKESRKKRHVCNCNKGPVAIVTRHLLQKGLVTALQKKNRVCNCNKNPIAIAKRGHVQWGNKEEGSYTS